MATFRICKYCGDLHDLACWPANHMDPEPARSDLSAPYYISDIMPAVQSMGNGKMYESKSEMRKHYKRDGLIEVGNDPARHVKFKRPAPDRKAMRDSIRKAAARVDRGDVRPQTRALMLTRPGTKPPKHRHTDAEKPMPTIIKPSFN